MSTKDSWKKTGKSIGHAFGNFGRAMGTTAKVVFGKEENSNGEGKKSKTGEAWSNVGHGFADAGKNFGHSCKDTVDNLDDKTKTQEEKEKDIKKDEAIDVEFEEKKES